MTDLLDFSCSDNCTLDRSSISAASDESRGTQHESKLFRHLLDIELRAAKSFALIGTDSNWRPSSSTFENILLSLEESNIENIDKQGEDGGSFVSYLSVKQEVEWAITTCLLGMAELEERNGKLSSSLSYLRTSIQRCKRVMTSIARGRLAEQRSSMLHYSLRWTVRLSRSLQMASIAYSRLGNRRRAEAYALASSEALSPSENWRGSSDLDPCNGSSTRQKGSRRLFLELKSRVNQKSITHSVPKDPSIGTKSLLLVEQVDVRIETARHFISCKFCLLILLRVFLIFSNILKNPHEFSICMRSGGWEKASVERIG